MAFKPKRWKTGKKPGWKAKAVGRGRTVKQVRKTQRRITKAAGTTYKPYRPNRKVGRSYNRTLGRGKKRSQF